jgi:hypothetical protein
MAAKVYGSGIFGVDAEGGMTVQSFDSDFSISEVLLPDEDGNDVSGAFFNEKVSFSMSGYEATGGTLDVGLGAAITLANDHGLAEFGVSSGGQTILKAGKRGRKNRDFGGLDASGDYLPYLGSLVV